MKATLQKNRIESVDALRGFALFGILWVNIYVFNAPYAYYGQFYGAFSEFNEFLVFISVSFFAGKFMFIFAFLFGYGAYLQQQRFKGESNFSSFWFRRMSGLAVFGIVHILFFWFGDILLPYALLGFTIPFLLKKSPKWLLVVGLGFYATPVIISAVFRLFDFPPIQMSSPYSLEEMLSIYSTSGFWELLPYRMEEYFALTNEKLAFYMPKEFALFCLGIAAAKMGFLKSKGLKGIQILLLLMVPVIWYTFRDEVYQLLEVKERGYLVPFFIGVNILFEILLCAGYIGSFGWLYSRRTPPKILRPFAIYGRLSLTNYFTQSLFCVLIFYGFGLGLFGSLNPVQLLGYTLGIAFIQMVFSHLWLKRYSQGPLEYLWRKWSYGSSKI